MKLTFRDIFKIYLILTVLIGCASTEKIKETDPAELVAQGNSFLKKGQFDQAIAYFNRAIEINPRYDTAYNNRGFVYYIKGQYDKAIADCTKVIEINPKYALAYKNRATAYFYKRQYEKA